MIFIGFDNGTSSNGIGVITTDRRATLLKLPVRKQLSYTKEAKGITRVDYPKLLELLKTIQAENRGEKLLAGLERPMVNSTRFNASLSAIRCLESTLIALEACQISYEYIDSKEWQKVLLPKGIKGSDELKKASFDIGTRMFPDLAIKKDADGLLIAEYLRRREANQLT